jgi:endoglucanase
MTAAQKKQHERWLRELTSIPTAAGHEDRVIAWIRDWVAARPALRMRRDRTGNLVITRRNRGRGRPLFMTAHLDHPAFVVRRMTGPRLVELEFRGGVHDPYFDGATIELFDGDDVRHLATLRELKPKAKPFKRAVAELSKAATLEPGDVGRWRFPGTLPRTSKGLLHTHACDDLAAAAAALATLDVLRRVRSAAHVGVLLTRAEEVGFVGALAVCRDRSVPRNARLVCLENSRSFADSPIGGGPILRVGDRMSVFDPVLTNRIGELLMAHERRHPGFRWQRKLMAGGACEATAFATHGFESTCVCLPLGNYHNMRDIDAVLAGKRPARAGPEYIALADYHGMIELLRIVATQLDSTKLPSLRERLDGLLAERGYIVETSREPGRRHAR